MWSPWPMFCEQLMLGSVAMLPNLLYLILPSHSDFGVF
jgi:hypothetical protein